ncbi:MAG: TonB family protein [Prevotellaceae bacterium]|jgi:TonB family protein|nr:TonB family protein [Prevotellaceae bacterium]
MSTKATRHSEENAKNRQNASIFVVVFYIILFLCLYKFKLAIKEPSPKEAIMEITLDEEVMRSIPQGVLRRNPQQKPVPNPPIVNTPGNTAPQSAVVAKSNQSTKPQPKPETKPSDLPEKGDVETQKPEPKKIDQKSLFQNNAKGEADEDNPTNVSENSLYKGVGRDDQSTRTENTPIGPDHRQAVTATLDGRSVVGSLPLPTYNIQNEGRVVVVIAVDQNGNVVSATATGKGSTVQDQRLWRAAEEAAKKAKFDVKQDAPLRQTGQITYVFKLS